MIVSEFHFWSPILGTDAVRISTANDLGQEYFAIIPRESARRWREMKSAALEALERAVLNSDPPGEIKL